MTTSTIDILRDKARQSWQKEGILNREIRIHARTLTTEEAIGNPEGDDFPLQRGKEKLMEAEFGTGRGQAFTDRFGDFSASLGDITAMPLENNFRRAIFVATLNAVQRELGKTEGTIHCRDMGPSLCAPKLASFLQNEYGNVRITQIGFQPKMIEALSDAFTMRIIDLDPDNIGSTKCGIGVEGPSETQDAIDWCDLLLVTGSTLVNGTIDTFLNKKPVVFFGTTIAAAADMMGWKRFCCQSS